MKNSQLLILAATVSGLLVGGSGVAEAAASKKVSAKDAQIQALERRLLALEKRLAESEARATGVGAAADAPVTVKSLDQKVKLIERKLEVEKEVADNEKKSASTFEAGSSGFKWTSADKQHQLRLRGFVQADGRFFMDDHETAALPNGSLTDQFLIRRARLQIGGTLWKYNDFFLAPDFGGNGPVLFDAWLDLHYLPFASLTVGKQKGPISLERLQSATNLLFAERGYASQLAPNREIGVMLHGEFAAPGRTTQYGGPVNFTDFLSYQLGVFNGAVDNVNPGNAIGAQTYLVPHHF